MRGLEPENVFTPRASSVNPQTYISRPELEKALERALRLPKHVVIHGESGTGKTWLYKKVLGDLGYHHEVANMGLCAANGIVADVLRSGICREITSSVDSARTVDGGLPGLAKVGSTQTEKTQQFHDAFYSALSAIRMRAREKPACLIFDNLEQLIHRPELVRELAGYLLLVDDQRYAAMDVRVMLVGTSSEIREFISQIRSSGPVANRITEVPEVARLSDLQANQFATNGFFDLLGCELDPQGEEALDRIIRLISFHSDKIPLHIQDLCFNIACGCQENNWILNEKIVIQGIQNWIKTSLVADVTCVQGNLNSIATKIGRRNQVIYCLGRVAKYDFSASDVEVEIRSQFPYSSSGVTLNLPQILSDLATSDHPLIRRNPATNQYRFIDPKYRIVVRWILHKDQGGALHVRDFDNAIGLWG